MTLDTIALTEAYERGVKDAVSNAISVLRTASGSYAGIDGASALQDAASALEASYATALQMLELMRDTSSETVQ